MNNVVTVKQKSRKDYETSTSKSNELINKQPQNSMPERIEMAQLIFMGITQIEGC